MSRLTLGALEVELVRKPIKNAHLAVLPPDGRVRLTAPEHMRENSLRAFAISKLSWIRQQQKRVRDQPREQPKDYLTKESHYVWGRRYLLKRIEADAAPGAEIDRNRLVLRVRPGTDELKCEKVLDAWYRDELRAKLPNLVEQWEPIIGVSARRIMVQRMKTMWGGCNPVSRIVRLNTDLAKKPIACLEYILVHEMTHLLEPSHNERFVSLMDAFLPNWRDLCAHLNALPVRHETWTY